MREVEIEKHLVKKVREHGGLTYKFVSPNNSGVPDRIVVYKGQVYFVELKTKKGKLRKIQEHQIKRLQAHGADARVVYGIEGVEKFMREVFGSGDF